MEYDVYYVDGCEDPERFHTFLGILQILGDAFSLIDFKYRQNEKTSETAKAVKKGLARYQVSSRKVSHWPLTETRDENHIYRMRTYRYSPLDINESFKILDVLETVGCLWDWDYPAYPMDLCFYRDGRVLFASCAHERLNELYLRHNGDTLSVMDLESIGLKLEFLRRVPEEALFRLPAEDGSPSLPKN